MVTLDKNRVTTYKHQLAWVFLLLLYHPILMEISHCGIHLIFLILALLPT